jgi:thioredoxin 1
MLEVSDSTWQQEVLSADLPVLVQFHAPWSVPCRQFQVVLEEVELRFEGRLRCMRLNVDESTQVPTSIGVRSIPTIALVQSGEVVTMVQGAQSAASLAELIQDWFGLAPQEGP